MYISKRLRRLINEMEKHGYYFDQLESYPGRGRAAGYYRFFIPGVGATHFNSIRELSEYIHNVCWD